MNRPIRIFVSLAIVTTCPGLVSAQVLPPTVIVKSGDAAPGLAGLTFGAPAGQAFAAPYMNATGTVSFAGGLTGPGVTTGVNDLALWTSTAGSIGMVARSGDTAPGIAGATFSALNSFGAIANNGSVAFRATVTGGGTASTNNSGYWVGTGGGTPALAVRGGDAAPGTGGATFSNFSASPMVLPGGQLYFSNTLVLGGAVTTTNDSGFWLGTPGSLQLVVREGDAAPGVTGAVLSTPNFSGINATGTASFRAVVTGGGVSATDNNVFFAGTAGSYQLLLRTGTTPAGIPAGQTVNGFAAISAVLANGQTYLSASLTGAGVTTANDGAVWVGTNSGDLQLQIRKGDQMPGQAAGVNFNGVGIPRAFGNTVVYQSTLAGADVTTANDNYVGSWTSAGGYRVVAREGNAAPNVGGALFGTFTNTALGDGQTPVVGPDGSIAFRASLTGTGVTTGVNDAALFLEQAGTLRLLARRGDVVSLGAGQGTGTIADLSFSATTNGMPVGASPFAADGSFAWLATLTDGRTVVFVTPVPEPGSVLALSALGLYAAARSGGSRKKSTNTASAAA